MKKQFRLFITLFFLFFTTYSLSDPINKINFIGLNNTSEANLLRLIPFKVNDEFLNSSSAQIIESLFETGLFSDITVTKNLNELDIALIENPIVKSFEIEMDNGSSFSNWLNGEKLLFSPEDLSEQLDEHNLSAGNAFTARKLDKLITLISSMYAESGYYNSQIKEKTLIDSQNRIALSLLINQGKQAKINLFSIKGNEKIPDDELIKLFKIGQADNIIINYFTKKDLFSESEFKKGIDLMTNKYLDSGYLDFKVLNINPEFNENNEKISLYIEIEEGPQYQLGDVIFSGDISTFTSQELLNALSMNKGEVFNRTLIIKDIQTLTDMFADKGYAFVDINPITSDVLNSVNINFEIYLNKKTYINRINISGNTRTQDEVIRREIGISEGGLYSRSVLRDSLIKLRRLGYFSDVQISTNEIEGMPDKIDINFLIEETQTGSVSFSVSHSNNYGVSFGAGIEEKNIFGSGNTLNASLNASKSFNRISFYFMNPNYNDEGHSLSFGAFKSEINDDDIATNSYEIDTTGFSLGYGVPLSDSTRLNTEFEFSTNEIKCSSLFAGTGYESSQCLSKGNDEFKLNINWNKDTLNNYLYPTDGVNNSISADIALPLGDYRYFNLDASHKSYRPIGDVSTLKFTGSFNLSKGYNGKELPFYKRNFGGGSGSVRGFGNKSLGPLYPNGKAKGGEIAILGSANLITPAFFFDNNEKMRLSAFVDAGNIFEKSSNIKLGDIRMSTGLGFAYLSPIGSIGAFISTPILKKDGDVIEDFGFSLGTGF